jgi:hypothetical protein
VSDTATRSFKKLLAIARPSASSLQRLWQRVSKIALNELSVKLSVKVKAGSAKLSGAAGVFME